MPPLFKRIAIVIGASLLWMKQALAMVAVPIVWWAFVILVPAGYIAGKAAYKAVTLYATGSSAKDVLTGQAKAVLAPASSINTSIDVTTGKTINISEDPSGSPLKPTKTKTCTYLNPPIVGPYAQFGSNDAYTPSVHSLIIKEKEVDVVGAKPGAIDRPPNPAKWSIDANLALSISPNSVDGFYEAKLPKPYTRAEADDLIKRMKNSDQNNWAEFGCQYESIEFNEEMEMTGGLSYLGEPNNKWPEMKYANNFYPAWKAIYEAISAKKIKPLSRVDIAVVDADFNSIKNVFASDGYVVDDLFNCAYGVCRKEPDTNELMGPTAILFHGSSVTSILAGSRQFIELSNQPYRSGVNTLARVKDGQVLLAAPSILGDGIDGIPYVIEPLALSSAPLTLGALGLGMNYGEAGIFHIHQYSELSTFAMGAALRRIINSGYKIVNLSLSTHEPFLDNNMLTVPKGDVAEYDRRLRARSWFMYYIFQRLQDNGVSVFVASANSKDIINRFALYRNAIAVGAISGSTGLMMGSKNNTTISISANPAFITPVGEAFYSNGKTPVKPAPTLATSLSAPMATATGALMKAVNPNLTAEQIQSIIVCTAQSVTIKNPLYDQKYPNMKLTFGILNAAAAVQAVIDEKLTNNLACIDEQPPPLPKPTCWNCGF